MGIRAWLNDPGKAFATGPTHQEVWNRENERFDKEANFITAQNAESRNHEFRMAQQTQGNQVYLNAQQHRFGIETANVTTANQMKLNEQQHGFNMATMQHMDNTGSVGEFHPSGMPSRYVPRSSEAFGSEDGPEPVAESRNAAAATGAAEGPSDFDKLRANAGAPIQRGFAGVAKRPAGGSGGNIGDLPR